MKQYLFSLSILILCVVSCKQDNSNKTHTQEEIAQHTKEFNVWLDQQFDQEVAESPQLQTSLGQKTDYDKWDDISSEKLANDLEQNKKRLEYLNDEINIEALDSTASLSYKLYKLNLENEIADYKYRFYNYPVNQMFGLHTEVPAFLINKHRIDSVADAKDYIRRVQNIKPLFVELRNQLSIRESNKITPPKFVLERVLEDCRNILRGRPFEKSATRMPLLKDFETKVNALEISQQQKSQLIREVEKAILDSLKPAYTELIAFVENQEKRANSDDGAWKFPHGEDFYTRALKRSTTTNMTAEDIHQFGLEEVSRIHNEMEAIMKKVEFKGSLQDFFKFMRNDEQFYFQDNEQGRAAYLKEAKAIIDKMRSRLDELFLTKPEADLIVKRVEAFRERSAGKAFYEQPAADGSRPGIYYANLYDIKAMPKYQMEALAYHEGIPGHHMQIAIAQELQDIPKFRKYGGYTAYIEGWGLYCEYIPKEMGFYEDPYSDFGRLAMELWRACRLVVDTGIHSKKWSRDEGVAYYKENTPNAESDCIKMVERHIVMPGQATAYKIGMNKIQELRTRAQQELGKQFDIREFHDVVLTNGAVPLSVLDELVENYIASAKEN